MQIIHTSNKKCPNIIFYFLQLQWQKTQIQALGSPSLTFNFSTNLLYRFFGEKFRTPGVQLRRQESLFFLRARSRRIPLPTIHVQHFGVG